MRLKPPEGCRAGAAMIRSDIEPISPVYASESSSEGVQANVASGTGDGGDPSRAEGELAEGPEVEEAQLQALMPSPALPSQSERMKPRIGHLPYRSWCDGCVEALGRKRSHRSASLDERVLRPSLRLHVSVSERVGPRG